MKIGVIGNFDKEIKPNSRGGTEVFTHSLVQQLVKSEEITSITVIGVGKNYFTNPKVSFIPILPEERIEFTTNHKFLEQLAKERTDFDAELRFGIANKILKLLLNANFNIIHDNSTSLVFTSLCDLLPIPLLTTLHTNILSPSVMIPYSLDLLEKKSKKQYFVTIANHQKKFAEQNNININIIQNIYNGIDLSLYPLNSDTSQKQNGLWLGRVKRKHNKGLKEAVLSAEKAKCHMNIAAQIDDQQFFQQEIEPYLGEYCQMLQQPQTINDKNKLYQQASYFIYPVQWEEPFGLVFLEAMASGTPVIAFARGAVPEIIKDGETGFIVNSSDNDIRGNWIVKQTGVDGLCQAIEQIKNMSDENYRKMRQACREHVEKHFTIERMAYDYEKVYQQILSQSH